ncbi:hypothetical protein AX774_g5485 [Zancudomyces culisetae]|uniref:Secreted peptide n=1 Tax=Zancudomyces culisetae TaxID=1213189 RepID=A0A1R1PJB6_ZANCU|nr:hypothetical protein AX774_g5485 [Zancudomyces culisetae]|eukprot:OMH81071.1 hypothetical protein AX774_g5485 [Zancudomyces culisetae]
MPAPLPLLLLLLLLRLLPDVAFLPALYSPLLPHISLCIAATAYVVVPASLFLAQNPSPLDSVHDTDFLSAFLLLSLLLLAHLLLLFRPPSLSLFFSALFHS